MNKTSIEWCRTYRADGSFTEGHSVNPVRFRPHGSNRTTTMCQKVSPGCTHCYAEVITRRFWPKDAHDLFPGYTALGLTTGELVLDEKLLISILRYKKPTRLFWGDMTDLFQDGVPDRFLDQCMAVCALTPHITHIFLTQRAPRLRSYIQQRTEDIARDTFRSQIARAMVGISERRGDKLPQQAAFELCLYGWPLPQRATMRLGGGPGASQCTHSVSAADAGRCARISAEPLLAAVDLRRIVIKKSTDLGPDVSFDSLRGGTVARYDLTVAVLTGRSSAARAARRAPNES